MDTSPNLNDIATRTKDMPPRLTWEKLHSILNGKVGQNQQAFLEMMQRASKEKSSLLEDILQNEDLQKEFGGEGELRTELENLKSYLEDKMQHADANSRFLESVGVTEQDGALKEAKTEAEQRGWGGWALDKIKSTFSVVSYPFRKHPVATTIIILAIVAALGGWWYLATMPEVAKKLSKLWQALGTYTADIQEKLFRATGPGIGGVEGAPGLTEAPSAPGPPPVTSPGFRPVPDYTGGAGSGDGGVFKKAMETAKEYLQGGGKAIDPKDLE